MMMMQLAVAAEGSMSVDTVCALLCKRGFWRQAWHLSGSHSARSQSKVESMWGAHLVHKKHPLDALAQAQSNLERRCIMQLVLRSPESLPPSGALLINTITDMRDFNAIFGEKMMTTLKAVGERTAFTYQLVERVRARPDEKRTTVDGEVARRVFISFANAAQALNFMETWLHIQMRTPSPTCMLECGTHDHTLRKWVLDVDASIAELKKDALLWPPSGGDEALLHAQTMAMAVNVSQALCELGFLHRPCHFSVTTRHSSKKMSWHITLNALAPHDVWRGALAKLERSKPLGKMYAYVDKGTQKNTKSQYMQVRGSTKVAPGVKADGNFFRDVGVFDGAGAKVEVPAARYSILFYAATSVVMHDPWSLPFKPQPAAATLPPPCKKAKHHSNHNNANNNHNSRPPTPDAPVIRAMTSWSTVPVGDAAWMRGLVERRDGMTRLISIPSMTDPRYWCDAVVRIVNAGRGELKVYAMAQNPALCPKHLKAEHRIHRHSSNHSMLAIVEEKHPTCKNTSFRMFMRCFSDKCRALRSPHCSVGGWVELGKPDYLMARAAMTATQSIA